jgi:GT2 family glycosyltransferase
MRLNAVLTLRHIGHHRSLYQYRFHPRSLTADWKTHRMLERRDRLMVFERARQDFYLQPMVWILQADPGLSAAVASVGHVVWSLEHPLHALPMHEMPLVYVKAGSALEARQAPSMQVPPQVPSVFVAIDGGTDIHAHAGWHQLITLGEPSEAAVPQRWWRVADLQTLVRTVDIWTKQRALQRLERAAEEPEVTSCKASIIICTNRGDQQVARTLDAVCSQEGCNSYEVILVDNSADGAACAINPVSLLKKDGRVSVRTVKWPAPGLSLARNAGLAAASGAIICFLDDDSVPQPDWLAHVMQAFDTHADVGVVGGHIRLRVPEPRPSAVRPGWEKYWSHFVTGYTEFTTVSHWWEFPWGANWAARRQALREAGGFRSAFGRVGSNYWGGEELVASAVIQRLGYRIGIEPRAEVIHEVQSSRFTFWHVCRTVIAGNLASYAAQRDLYIPRDIGVRSQLRALMTDHWDPTLPTMPSRLASFGARKVGQVAVLAAVAADILRRMRRPAAMRGR